jgi:Arc/MetJ family transcription regulator
MTKRLVDLDDNKLAAVQALLGTRTLKATVNEALDEVLALDRRRRALLAAQGLDDALLSDPEARVAAWGLIPRRHLGADPTGAVRGRRPTRSALGSRSRCTVHADRSRGGVLVIESEPAPHDAR